MKDPEIRNIIKLHGLGGHNADALIVDEFSLTDARIDVAIISDKLHGYEIKGASDTLARLPNQIEAYSKVFDYLTIVTESKYVNKIIAIAPDWCGIAVCANENCYTFKVIREPKENPRRDGFHISKLLWKEELQELLFSQNIKVRKSERNWTMCEIIRDKIELNTTTKLVIEKLKARTTWRVDNENKTISSFALSVEHANRMVA